MMRCENCFHECTRIDFSTFRNLCEHLYLDALAEKTQSVARGGSNFHKDQNKYSVLVGKS